MTDENLYEDLSAKINISGSKYIPRIWRMIVNEDEARLLLAMPGTAAELAERTGREPEKVKAMVRELFHKGVVFEKGKGEETQYRPPRHPLQFHDGTILWPEAPRKFLDLWQTYMDEEYPEFIKMMDAGEIRSFMRVIPVNRGIESKSQVLPSEDALKMIDQADKLAVTKCTCRLTAHRCQKPLEACLQINRAAEYAIKRGTGRELTKDQAREIIRIAEEAGLVHMTENRGGIGQVICNCCDDCCMMLVLMKKIGAKCTATPSRYRVRIAAGDCTGCGACLERCPMEILAIPKGKEVVESNLDKCIGCGLCTTVCSTRALVLEEIRPADFIPEA
ncbi:MAG: 4Fe-4S binding protein [bacterium]|nr:4Fe-4S binding protein [bacterium]